MMKTSALSSGLTLYLLQQDSSGAWIQTGIQSPTGTYDWRKYARTIITGPNAVQGYLKAYISSGYGTVWLDDVRLTDVFGGDQPVAFGGTVTSPGGVLTQTANTNGLNLVAKYINAGSAIKVETTLTDTTGSDRGVEVAFRLPLDIPGWTWDRDFVTPMAIATGTRYENLDTSLRRLDARPYPFELSLRHGTQRRGGLLAGLPHGPADEPNCLRRHAGVPRHL